MSATATDFQVSVIIPILNEKPYLCGLFESVRKQTIRAPVEFLFVDGGSVDGTTEEITGFQKTSEGLDANRVHRLLHNPNRTVPYALNLGVNAAKGAIIVRWDAHTEYAENYLEETVRTFQSSGTDIVGGPMRASRKTVFQEAVCLATSRRLGIGNSRFHFPDYEGETDSVYLGAWKRDLFSNIGLFDVALKRNQDDEFHYRAKSQGAIIYQNPKIRSLYFPQSNLVGFVSQYFGYGYFKPMVLVRVPSEMKLRHLVPSAFVLYLVVLLLGLIDSAWVWLPLLSYSLLCLGASATSSGFSLRSRLLALLLFPAMHVAYGVGFLAGLPRSFLPMRALRDAVKYFL